VDISVLALITDEQMEQLGIKHWGDRLAIKTFCSQSMARNASRPEFGTASRDSRREELVIKLKRKAECSGAHGIDTAKDSKMQLCGGPSGAYLRKTERRLEVGWVHRDSNDNVSQVKEKFGGGIRKLCVGVNDTFECVLAACKKVFFVEGESKMGRPDEFEFGVCACDNSELNLKMTVYEYIQERKPKMLRVRMLTRRVDRGNEAVTDTGAESDASSDLQDFTVCSASTESTINRLCDGSSGDEFQNAVSYADFTLHG